MSTSHETRYHKQTVHTTYAKMLPYAMFVSTIAYVKFIY